MPPMNRFKDVLDHVGADVFQDALLASHAVYADSPHHFLEGNGHRFSHLSVSRLPQADGRLLIALSHSAVDNEEGAEPAPANEEGTKLHTTEVDAAKPATARKLAFLAFRGTSNFEDLKANVNFFPVLSQGFHTGFFMRSKMTPIATILDLVHDGYQLIFTGHSLGGGVAQIATWHVLCKLALPRAKKARKPICVTFAAPLVATGQTAYIINENYKHRFFNVVDREDAVPKIVSLAQELGQRSLGNPQAINSMLRDKKQGAKSLFKHVQDVLKACGAQCMLGQGLQGTAVPALCGFLRWTLKTFEPAILSLVAFRPIGVICTAGRTISVHTDEGELQELLKLSNVTDITLDNITAHSLAQYTVRLQEHLHDAGDVSGPPPLRFAEVPHLIPSLSRVEFRLLPEVGRLRMLLRGNSLSAITKVGIDGVRICEGQEAFSVEHDNQTNAQLLLECPLPEDPGNVRATRTLDVWLTTTFQPEPIQFKSVRMHLLEPQYAGSAANASLTDVLRQAAAVSLFAEPSAQRLLEFQELPCLLGELLDILPLELAFLPLAKGEPLHTAINQRILKVKPPCAMLASEVGLKVLGAALAHLSSIKPSEWTERDTQVAIQANGVVDFVKQATNNFSFYAATGALAAGAVGTFSAVGSYSAASSYSAAGFCAVAAAGAVYRHLQTVDRLEPSDIEQLLQELKEGFNQLRSGWERVGSPQFCGESLSVLVESFDSVGEGGMEGDPGFHTIEPLFNFAHALAVEKANVAQKEHAVRQASQNAVATEEGIAETRRALKAQLVSSFIGVFEKVGLAEHFYHTMDTEFDIGLTFVPYDRHWLTTLGRGTKAVGRTAFHGTIGRIAALGKAAWEWDIQPLVDCEKTMNDIWTKDFSCDIMRLESYEDFVSYIFKVLLPEVVLPSAVLVQEERVAGMLSNQRFAIHARTPVKNILQNWDRCFPEECALQLVPEGFRFSFAVRIKAALVLHKMRMHLASLPLVGVFGPSNAGKTTICRAILGRRSRMMPKPGMSFEHRTLVPGIFLLPRKQGTLLDTAGADDKGLTATTEGPLVGVEERLLSDTLRQVCSCQIILVSAIRRDDVSEKYLALTRTPSRHAERVPALTCITFVDQLLDDDDDDDDGEDSPNNDDPDGSDDEDDVPLCHEGIGPETKLDREERYRSEDGCDAAIRSLAEDKDTPRCWACLKKPKEFRAKITQDIRNRVLSREDIVKWVYDHLQSAE